MRAAQGYEQAMSLWNNAFYNLFPQMHGSSYRPVPPPGYIEGKGYGTWVEPTFVANQRYYEIQSMLATGAREAKEAAEMRAFKNSLALNYFMTTQAAQNRIVSMRALGEEEKVSLEYLDAQRLARIYHIIGEENITDEMMKERLEYSKRRFWWLFPEAGEELHIPGYENAGIPQR